MPYPLTCAGALLAMKQSASMSLTYSNKCLNHMSDAWGHWHVGEDHEAIFDILYGLSDTNVAAGYAGYGYTPFSYFGPWWWYLTNCVGAVTLYDMLNAVTDPDTPDNQREEWVLIWDAYRATMYEKPFSLEFHSFWIRYFKSWT